MQGIAGGSAQCRLQVRVKWLQVQDDEEEEDWWIIAGCIIARCTIAGCIIAFYFI